MSLFFKSLDNMIHVRDFAVVKLQTRAGEKTIPMISFHFCTVVSESLRDTSRSRHRRLHTGQTSSSNGSAYIVVESTITRVAFLVQFVGVLSTHFSFA